MSKVRINDLAREMEVKTREILDVLAELGLAGGKTHSSSLEAGRGGEGSRALCAGRADPRPMQALRHARHAAASHRPQDRSLAHLQARRCDEGHPGQEEGRGRRGAPRSLAGEAGSGSAGQICRARRACRACRTPARCGSGCSSSGAAPRNRARLFRSRARRRPLLPPGPSSACHRFASARRRRGCQGSRRRCSRGRPVVVVAPPPVAVVVKPPAAPAAREEQPAAKTACRRRSAAV